MRNIPKIPGPIGSHLARSAASGSGSSRTHIATRINTNCTEDAAPGDVTASMGLKTGFKIGTS
ncbi:hypothetical protein [Bradyrhizobium genosp. P]|uniref:hypothetical protein n=1 Tax=Bradyrhizobium genosp. P TaxID=83641 RepID=UPI003CFA930C